MRLTFFLGFIISSIIMISCSSKDEQTIPEDFAPTLNFSIAGTQTSPNGSVTVSETLVINIEAKDANGITKVEAFINDIKVGEDNTAPFTITVDLMEYTSISGKSNSDLSAILRVVATDGNGNQTEQEQDIIIITKTVLLTVNIPEGLLNSFLQNVYVFASDMEGNYLEDTLEPITTDTRSIKIYAPEDFDVNNEFMITFMTYNPEETDWNGINWSYATTYQNLKIENPSFINLNVPERFSGGESIVYNAVNFETVRYVLGAGIDYGTSLYKDEGEWIYSITNPVTSSNRTTDKIYLSYTLSSDPVDYYYLLIDKPLPSDFQLNANNFENINSKAGSISYLNFEEWPTPNDFVVIYGYENELDFELNNFHTITSKQLVNKNIVNYSYNDSFYAYRHELHLANFYMKGTGIPQDEITIPEWTLDPIVENNRIVLNKVGEGHSVGRIQLREDNENEVYDWRLVFNSKNINTVKIPKIPQNINNPIFLEKYNSNSFKIQHSELSRFEGISNYDDYLSEIVKENRNVELYTRLKESKFKSNPDVYFQYNDLIFD